MRRALRIPPEEIEWTAVRSQGAGGQKVNKVSSAVHLRFDIAASSLPDDVKRRLLALPDQRITRDGVLVIKAQAQRSQAMNHDDALQRLRELVEARTASAAAARDEADLASKRRRLDGKQARAKIKAARSKVVD